MTADAESETGLKAAYDLRTPDDSRRLYRQWAGTYDTTFVADQRYEYPARIAALFAANGGDGPVLDVGCGTGAVAEALGARPVDGVDISPEMLDVARTKGLYRSLIEADLTAAPALPAKTYRGVVSAGTFTHGHVGPEALLPLIETALPGALFVLGVNAELFERQPFEAVLQTLVADGVISGLSIAEGRIYGEDARHDHADDLFRALVFWRC